MTPATKRDYVRALQPILQRVRRDISAIKFDDGSRWTQQPLTVEAMMQHVNGGPPRGACPIKEGESVTMLALLDLDSHKGDTPWDDMLAAAAHLTTGLSLWGLECRAFRSSGGRGVHLYMLWEQPQDAYSVRRHVVAAIESCGFTNGARGVAQGQVEVFPKQDEVGPGENGNQFILPLAGASEPLDLELGLAMGRDSVLGMTWPMSLPVPVLERPLKLLTDLPDAVEPLDKVREALFSIRNDGAEGSPDYDEWRNLCFAVHEALGGADEAKALFEEWSAQNPIFDQPFFENRVWEYVKDAGKRTTAITRGTLYARATAQGWNSATADGFVDVIEAASPQGTALEKTGGATPEAVPAAQGASAVAGVELPAFERKKDGGILSTIGNLLKALRRPDVCGWRISHDRFRDEIMISTNGGLAWREFRDADYTRMREYLEKNQFEPIGKEMMRDCVELVAQETGFDSAQLWLNSLQWDGVPRVEVFMSQYMGCDDEPYSRAVSRYLWSALAGRVIEPGCQADMTPVLIGDQGSGKTSAVKCISPSLDFYVEIGFHEKEDDLARKMRGKLVGEFGELTGMRKKEVDAQKAFISRTHEAWIPKFKEFGAKFPRRLLFIGTTNNDKFLIDDTGNRRWLPIRVGKTRLAALRADVLQLWAEARELFRSSGVLWQEAETLAREIHDQHFVDDPWQDRVETWLESPDLDGTKVRERSHLTTAMVLFEGLRLEHSRATKADEMRAAVVLKKAGYFRTKIRVDGMPKSVFVPTLFPPEKREVGTDVPF